METRKVIQELISEEIRRKCLGDADKSLSEERHISAEVTKLTNTVASTLQQAIRQTTSVQYDEPNVTVKRGQFAVVVDGIRLHVIWEFYNNLKPMEYKPKVRNKAFVKRDTLQIFLCFVGSNGTVDKAFLYQTVQHEMCHFYELLKRDKKPFEKSYGLYKLASTMLASHRTHQELALAYIISCSRNFEIRAYGNGAYQYMMQCGDYEDRFEGSMRKTLLYQNYECLKWAEDVLNHTQSNSKEMKEALQPYEALGYSYDDFIKTLHYALNNSIKLLGVVRSKAIDDFKEKYGIMEDVFVTHAERLEETENNKKDIMTINEKYGLIL